MERYSIDLIVSFLCDCDVLDTGLGLKESKDIVDTAGCPKLKKIFLLKKLMKLRLSLKKLELQLKLNNLINFQIASYLW